MELGFQDELEEAKAGMMMYTAMLFLYLNCLFLLSFSCTIMREYWEYLGSEERVQGENGKFPSFQYKLRFPRKIEERSPFYPPKFVSKFSLQP
jgi:hypothetical protein